jgi:sulfonate transport system permease protein
MNRGVALIAPLVLLSIWAVLTGFHLVPQQVLVSPGQVAAALYELSVTGELGRHLAKTLARLATGFCLGGALGLLFGILMGVSARFEQFSRPVFQAVRQIPSLALIPAFILVFGVDETFKIVLVSKASFFPIALAAFDGVRSIPKAYVEVAAVNRVSRLTLLTKLVIPATTPPLVAGIRISLGRSWMVLVAAELMAADSGVGQMMEMGRQMFRMDVVVAGVFLTGAIGLALDSLVRLAERRLSRWSFA